HDADAESGEVEAAGLHDAGVLSRLAAEERAAGAAATLRDAGDDRRDLLGDDALHGEVVEEEERLRPRADDVVRAHRDEIDPDRVEPSGEARDLGLRSHAVGSSGAEPPAAD